MRPSGRLAQPGNGASKGTNRFWWQGQDQAFLAETGHDLFIVASEPFGERLVAAQGAKLADHPGGGILARQTALVRIPNRALFQDEGITLVGMGADLVVLNLTSTPAIAQRSTQAQNIWSAIFPTIMMGDDRAVQAL